MNLALCDMSCGYRGRPVLEHISFTVHTGEILCLLGPNGVGKTTLFKSMLGLLPPLAGRVELDGEDIARWTDRRRAQKIGYIPQSHVPPFPYSVLQVVVMGRTAHLGLFASPGPDDEAQALAALEQLGIAHLKDKIYTEISGGERQMVLIARALAQRPQVLLMDEPTANLDFGNQARVLSVINRLAGQGMAVVMTTHTPDHAFLCSSKVALLERGSRVTFGSAEEIITPEHLRRAYGIEVCLTSAVYQNHVIRGCMPLTDAVNPAIR